MNETDEKKLEEEITAEEFTPEELADEKVLDERLLSEIAGGGVTTGVISTASIGNFSKSYDLSKTMLDTQDAMFWNQSSYGAELMALLKTKSVPSVFVVTSAPIVSPNPVTKKGESNEE